MSFPIRPAPFRPSRRAAAFGLGAAASLFAFSTNAQTAPARLGLCAACHGERGTAATPLIPNLAGQNLPYLRAAFAAYRAGTRDVPAMRAAASMLSEADADTVLAWYAAQPPAKTPAP